MINPIVGQMVIGVVSFFLGTVFGYAMHDILKKSFDMTEENSKNFLLVVVTLIWAISMLVGIVNSAYEVPVAVHALMGSIVGFFFYKPGKGGK